jgi:polysaccharide biosynthesis transport protein
MATNESKKTPLQGEFAAPQDLDLLHWVQILWDNRWWITGVTLAVVILVALYTFLATPIYSATSVVYVQTYSRQPMSGFNPTGASSWMEEQKFYNSQQQIMTSSAVMQEVVDRLKLQNHPGFQGSKNPAAILRGMTKVDNIRDSALFRITVMAPYRSDVALWANTIADVYQDRMLRDALDYISKANDVMLSEAKKMQDEYVRQQSTVTSTLAASGSYFPQNQKDILDKQIASINERLTEVSVKESEVAAVASQLEAWQRSGGDPLGVPAVAQDPSVQDLAKQYNELNRELGKLLSKYTPKHPEVLKKQDEIRALKERISQQAGVVLAGYRNQLAALRAEKANLAQEVDGARRQGLQFVEGASRGEALTTSSAAIKKYMDLLYDKMRELNVSASLLSSNVRLVEPAQMPNSPVKPNKRMNLLMGLLFGLMLSVGSIVAWQYLDTSVKSVEDLESRMGVPLLTMVPKFSEETRKVSAEAFQTLRTALVYASENQQNNVILITSASPKEGKTSVAANLAKTLAANGERVLLMDCDLRKPSIQRILKAPAGVKGLTNFLAERSGVIEDFILPGPQPNLFVLYSGPTPPNPPELFSMKRFSELLDRFKKEYSWVVIDSPPCLSISDAFILGSMANLAILVARYRKTQKPLLERILVTLERANVQVAGVVLNEVETRSSYYYDYYYYNHYYYSTGNEPQRLPWIVGRVGGWKDVFKMRRKKRVYPD